MYTHMDKSLFLADAISNALEYPGIRIGIVSRNYPESQQDFVYPLFTNAGGLGISTWIQNKYKLKLPNGSVIHFLYGDTLESVYRIAGAEFQVFYIDGRIPFEVIKNYECRVRGLRDGPPTLGVFLS